MIDPTQRVTLNSELWSAGTRVQLCRVPWDAQYRDIVNWRSEDHKRDWFDKNLSQGWMNTQAHYLPYGVPVRLPVPFSTCYQYNYLAVTNPQQPVDMEGPVRTYYYFITDTRYISPQVTEVDLQLDVMTTYGLDVKFGSMFVERGHIAVANKTFWDDFNRNGITGRLINNYLTVPEGLDAGSDYATYKMQNIPLDLGRATHVVVMSTTELTNDPGTLENPKLSTAEGSKADGLFSGSCVYALDVADFEKAMLKLSDCPWVSQGIIAIMLIPDIMLPPLEGNARGLLGTDIKLWPIDSAVNVITQAPSGGHDMSVDLQDMFESETPDTYRDYMKLLTYPYTVIEVTNYTGNPVLLKPELIDGISLAFRALSCCLPGMARLVLYPNNYNGASNVVGIGSSITTPSGENLPGPDGSGESTFLMRTPSFMDNAVIYDNFPQFSIVNNGYLMQVASTTHSRQYQYQAAGWVKDKSMMNAANQVTNWNTQAGAQIANQAISQDLARKNQFASALKGGIGAVGALAGLNIGGAVSGALNTAIDYVNTGAQIAGQQQQFANTMDAGAQVVSNNYTLAQKVASGDYQNTIAGINAAVQDMQLTSPTVSGQAGGNPVLWKFNAAGTDIRIKGVTWGAMKRLVQYWARYGYAVHQFIVWHDLTLDQMQVMSHASYWKVSETYITCATANETEKDVIRGIFEKGVTIWQEPEDIGNIEWVSGNKPIKDKLGY